MRIKFVVFSFLFLFLFSLFSGLVGFGVGQVNSYYVSVGVGGRNVVFAGDSVSLVVSSNSSSVLLWVGNSLNVTVYSGVVDGNSSTVFSPVVPYGLFTVRGIVGNVSSESWFWLQDVSGLVSFSLPYSWSWKGIDYTLSSNYSLVASKAGSVFSTEWLSEIFVKFKPSVSLYRNGGLLRVVTVGKDVDCDSWIMNTYFGVKIRVNGSLASVSTLKWNYKAVVGSVLWRVGCVGVGALLTVVTSLMGSLVKVKRS